MDGTIKDEMNNDDLYVYRDETDPTKPKVQNEADQEIMDKVKDSLEQRKQDIKAQEQIEVNLEQVKAQVEGVKEKNRRSRRQVESDQVKEETQEAA